MAEARRDSPESEAWLGLLESALAEGEAGAVWENAVPPTASSKRDRPAKLPLLADVELTVDGRAARKWVGRLLGRTARLEGRKRPIDGMALLEAALNQDDERVDALAAAAGADPHAVRVVGQMAVLPLLLTCARRMSRDVASSWWEGYCPLCGAWPVLVEYTGLERKRQLRCGRCGTAWAVPALRCAFCDETDHESLGYLTPEGDDQTRKIEVCNACKGYLKGLTTVRPLAAAAILLDDLRTVPLDVVALERGFRRPERPGYALGAKVVGDGAGRRGWWRL